MKLRVQPGALSGSVDIPGSKSHTIRGLILGMLADGQSVLRRPLRAADTESCVRVCEALGARVDAAGQEQWTVRGTAGRPTAARGPVDVGNSGTTLFLAMTAAALAEGETEFTGDEQTSRRPAGPLMDALRALGATAYSRHGNGCAPLVVGGGLRGGHVTIECPISQYLSSLLIGCPLAAQDTTIGVPLLNEKPYAGMTLGWLDALGARYRASEDFSRFEIPGRQRYPAFDRAVAADFSSATFFLAAAAVTRSRLFLRGLDMADTQGDKAVAGMFQQMGCVVEAQPDGLWIEGPDELEGMTFDLNATPDALPSLAVAGCFARGETRLLNVPQARAKETDRLTVMSEELRRMGGRVEELADGLIVRPSRLSGTEVSGRADHRAVMALAVAGLAAEGVTTIDTAEAVSVTFPNFVELMQQAGARMEIVS
jgi:3-phosphoshikimate 1-carboxyvinyltransferase